ncbi:hypothetical protein ACHAWU_001765 [Discostella pseudostelligera]|uniref:Uncharacterized protein n=1 Tax=Discostella pseudostelligera TaxID=259834 RepID=A0ABD3M834_9STRA
MTTHNIFNKYLAQNIPITSSTSTSTSRQGRILAASSACACLLVLAFMIMTATRGKRSYCYTSDGYNTKSVGLSAAAAPVIAVCSRSVSKQWVGAITIGSGAEVGRDHRRYVTMLGKKQPPLVENNLVIRFYFPLREVDDMMISDDARIALMSAWRNSV